jgi:hypothetical protein
MSKWTKAGQAFYSSDPDVSKSDATRWVIRQLVDKWGVVATLVMMEQVTDVELTEVIDLAKLAKQRAKE